MVAQAFPAEGALFFGACRRQTLVLRAVVTTGLDGRVASGGDCVRVVGSGSSVVGFLGINGFRLAMVSWQTMIAGIVMTAGAGVVAARLARG